MSGRTMTHSRHPETRHQENDDDFTDIARDMFEDASRRIRRSAAYIRFSWNQSRQYGNGSSKRRVPRSTSHGSSFDTSQGRSVSNAASRISQGVRRSIVSLSERVGSILRSSGIWTPNTAGEEESKEERNERPVASACCMIQYDSHGQSLDVGIDCDELFLDNIQQAEDDCIYVKLQLLPESSDKTVYLQRNGIDCYNETLYFGGIAPESVRQKVLMLTLYSQRQKGDRKGRLLRQSEVHLTELTDKAMNVYWNEI